MDKALKSLLMSLPCFQNAYRRAKSYVRENIYLDCDYLDLSENTNCDVCFPITEDNLYILGLDRKTLTIWVFFDTHMADL